MAMALLAALPYISKVSILIYLFLKRLELYDLGLGQIAAATIGNSLSFWGLFARRMTRV
ncbi:MAG TPA: hypothetical protein VER14_00280 [Phototrophicaceae bacterium]|nr:hypothetical protein [Phototrophicaceae bacterium]